MAQQPKKQKTTQTKPKVAPTGGAKNPVQKSGIKSACTGIVIALKGYFVKANGYEAFAMFLFICVLLVLVLAHPGPDMLRTALRILALMSTMAAKFMSNSGLSANPGSPANQADAKRLSLLMDGVAALLTVISFLA